MPRDDHDDHVARLLRALLALEADAHFRCRLVRDKCASLERVLAYVARAHAARLLAQEAAQRRQAAAQAETRSLESSIGDAIRRARRIRQQLASTPRGIEEKDEEDDGGDEPASEVGGILTQARAIRATQPPSQPADGDGGHAAALPQPSPRVTRLEYPRRMKSLLDLLEDREADERVQSFRVGFCRKMVEHVSLRERVTDGTATTELRIQVGYARQVERLGHAYRRIGDFLEAKGDLDSVAVQKALQTPSLSSVFPVYCRLQLARALLAQLHDATKSIAQSLPSRPSLSQAAISHRDMMLDKFRKKTPTFNDNMAFASNQLLLSSASGSQFIAHTPLLEKLQLAWEQQTSEKWKSRRPSSPYANVTSEIILSEMSNLVLSTFQGAFCEGRVAPSHSTVRELMGVIRVVESAVLHQARRQRSVVHR